MLVTHLNVVFSVSLGVDTMAPLLLSSLVGSLTRQMSQVARCAASCSLPAVGAQRCISTITGATMQFRRFFNPMCKPHTAFLSPLLGQCQQLLCVQQSAGMKTKTALKRRCKDCFFVRRRGRLFVFCKSHPRHKQRQGWINEDLSVCSHATGSFSNEDLRIICLEWCIWACKDHRVSNKHWHPHLERFKGFENYSLFFPLHIFSYMLRRVSVT